MIYRIPKINENKVLDNLTGDDRIEGFNLSQSIKFDRVSFKYPIVPKE